MPIKRDIIYQIFLECCKYTVDEFWYNIFEELSYGITPYATYISKGFFCSKAKGKEFSYKIKEKNPKKMHDDIYKLLKKKVGILSNEEQKANKIRFCNVYKEIKSRRKDWSLIRKKSVKNILIEKYIIRQKNKLSLTIEQCKYLISIILILIQDKIISNEDIIYKDGEILDIKSFNIEEDTFSLVHDIFNNDLNDSLAIHEKEVMKENWKKYLTTLEKTMT